LSTGNGVMHTDDTGLQGLCHHFCPIPSVNNAVLYNVKHICISKLHLRHRFRPVNCMWCTQNLVYTVTFWTCVSLNVPASLTMMHATGS